jgi:UDP-glucose 4-epimerase
LPVDESHGIHPSSPYGWTKAMTEQVLRDICHAQKDFVAVCLRYFNPIGAHESGLIGEDPKGVPNNLFPFITQVAAGKQPELKIYGGDYATVDGTGVRDYLHVGDLAGGHVKALDYALGLPQGEFRAINLGTGKGTSVLQLVQAFQRATGIAIPYRVCERRPGDVAELWADPRLAWDLLGWKTTRGVDQMCRDGWRWQAGTRPSGVKA